MTIKLDTVPCRYNGYAANFLTNIHKRHSTAHLLGQGFGCLLWIQHLIDILPQFLQSFMQYLIILDRITLALSCIVSSNFPEVVAISDTIFINQITILKMAVEIS